MQMINRMASKVARLMGQAAAALLILHAGQAAANCRFTVPPTPLAFGIYDVSSPAPLDAQSGFEIRCTKASNGIFSVGVSANSGSTNPRQMKHLTLNDRINYNIFSDAGRTQVWGEGASAVYRYVAANERYTGPLYGRIPPGQNITFGNYSDTVVITLMP